MSRVNNTSIVSYNTILSSSLGPYIPSVLINLISGYDHRVEGKSISLKGLKTKCKCMHVFADGSIAAGSGNRMIIWDSHGIQKKLINILSNCEITSIASLTVTASRAGPGLNEKILIGTKNGHVYQHDPLTDERILVNGLKMWCEIRGVDKIDDSNMIIHGYHQFTIWNPYTNDNYAHETERAMKNIIILSDNRVAHSAINTIRIFNQSTNKYVLTLLNGHHNTCHINCIDVLSDNRIVSGADDSTIKIYSIDTVKDGLHRFIYNPDATLHGHDYSVTCLKVLPDDTIVSGSNDTTIKIWKKQHDGKYICEKTLSGHYSAVTCLQILADGRIVSGSEDGSIRIWDLARNDGLCDMVLDGHTNPIKYIYVLPDCSTNRSTNSSLTNGRFVSMAIDEKNLKLWY